jgi:hypothetical protein
MPTLRTVTVKPSGGDYATLAAAISGEAANLVSLDRQLDIECYSMTDTTAVNVTGFTTDATRYIRIFTPSAERHDGKLNTGKYLLKTTAAFTTTLTISEEYVRIEGLQIWAANTGTDESRPLVVSVGATSDVRVESCIIRNDTTGSSGTSNLNTYHVSGVLTVRNSVLYGGTIGVNCNGTTTTIQNCTITKMSAHAINRSAGTATVTNTYASGTTDAYTGTMTRTTCAHDTATVFAGSTASIAHDTTNFTNVTGGSEDYHLVSGASATLKTGGTDLSGTFTTDIDGQTRSVPFSIGADQIVAGNAGARRRRIILCAS